MNERGALVVAWLRVIYAVAFAYALLNLVGVAQLLNGASAASLQSDQLHAQVATSVTAFRTGWDLALAIFGLHLVGLGGLLYRSVDFPRFLGVLVIIAGAGYLADSFGRIFVPGYTLTISTFTFFGEALLIVWLFKVAIKGSRSIEHPRAIEDTPTGVSRGGRVMNALHGRHLVTSILGGSTMNVLRQARAPAPPSSPSSARSPSVPSLPSPCCSAPRRVARSRWSPGPCCSPSGSAGGSWHG